MQEAASCVECAEEVHDDVVPPSHLRALETARECARLGASRRMIQTLTGLPPTDIGREIYGGKMPCGRPSGSLERVFRSNLASKEAAARFAATFQRLLNDDVLPSQAVVAACRSHHDELHAAGFGFDTAFVIAAELQGLWYAYGRPSLDLITCRRCRRLHLGMRGDVVEKECDFCRRCSRRGPGDKLGGHIDPRSPPCHSLHAS